MFSINTISQKLVWFFIILLVSVSSFSPVQAAGGFGLKTRGSVLDWGELDVHPPRGVGILNLKKQHSSGIFTNLQGICYDVLEKENKPFYLYLETGFRVKTLEIAPVVGYAFRDKEMVAGVRLYQDSSIWRGHSNLEYQFDSKSFYGLVQLSLKIKPFFDLGGEVEVWGDLNDDLSSTGIGIVSGFNLEPLKMSDKDSKIRIEAAIQIRELMNQWKGQLTVRFSFTPHMDDHTKSKRQN